MLLYRHTIKNKTFLVRICSTTSYEVHFTLIIHSLIAEAGLIDKVEFRSDMTDQGNL